MFVQYIIGGITGGLADVFAIYYRWISRCLCNILHMVSLILGQYIAGGLADVCAIYYRWFGRCLCNILHIVWLMGGQYITGSLADVGIFAVHID
jgi:hypothetical protein